MARRVDPEVAAEARRWRRIRAVSLVLAALVGGAPILGFAAASAAALVGTPDITLTW